MDCNDVKVVFDANQSCTQDEFGRLVGISQSAVSDLKRRGVIAEGQTLGEWLRLYCSHLEKIGNDRAASGDLELATERAKLAKAQRERIDMQNAVTLSEFGPIAELEKGLSHCMAAVSSKLGDIPNRLAQEVASLNQDDLMLVSGIIVEIQHDISAIEVDWFYEKSLDVSDDDYPI